MKKEAPTKTYEVTFIHPNDSWTWIYTEAKDFHMALLKALLACPDDCRVRRVIPTEKKPDA